MYLMRAIKALLKVFATAFVGVLVLTSLTALGYTQTSLESRSSSSASATLDQTTSLITAVPANYECFAFVLAGWSHEAPSPLITVADAAQGYDPSLHKRDQLIERQDILNTCTEFWSPENLAPNDQSSMWECRFQKRPTALCTVTLYPITVNSIDTDEWGCELSYDAWGYPVGQTCDTPAYQTWQLGYLTDLYEEYVSQRASGLSCGLGPDRIWLTFEEFFERFSNNEGSSFNYGCEQPSPNCVTPSGIAELCDSRPAWCDDGAIKGGPGWCDRSLPPDQSPVPSATTLPSRTWIFNECVVFDETCDYLGESLQETDPRLPMIYEQLKAEIEAQVSSGRYRCTFNTPDGRYPQTFLEWLRPNLVEPDQGIFECRANP